jgi:hypothetical protein
MADQPPQNEQNKTSRAYVWRTVTYAFLGMAFLLFFSAVSYIFVDAPTQPDPLTGRIYPLNNHGHVTYLTRREDRTRKALFVAAVTLATTAIFIDWRTGSGRSNRKSSNLRRSNRQDPRQ